MSNIELSSAGDDIEQNISRGSKKPVVKCDVEGGLMETGENKGALRNVKLCGIDLRQVAGWKVNKFTEEYLDKMGTEVLLNILNV
ncbi:5435_t:CDS:2 [Paraglomus brasilianum]|uniref:5435_t:CDS:1 n=1 Tax=Paraglomus brasilianum TaxID=144538 RepID=A0A9N9CW48_9GLOM|nr:5435_t:CDS:2 [Paraglomus brasilianum]